MKDEETPKLPKEEDLNIPKPDVLEDISDDVLDEKDVLTEELLAQEDPVVESTSNVADANSIVAIIDGADTRK